MGDYLSQTSVELPPDPLDYRRRYIHLPLPELCPFSGKHLTSNYVENDPSYIRRVLSTCMNSFPEINTLDYYNVTLYNSSGTIEQKRGALIEFTRALGGGCRQISLFSLDNQVLLAKYYYSSKFSSEFKKYLLNIPKIDTDTDLDLNSKKSDYISSFELNNESQKLELITHFNKMNSLNVHLSDQTRLIRVSQLAEEFSHQNPRIIPQIKVLVSTVCKFDRFPFSDTILDQSNEIFQNLNQFVVSLETLILGQTLEKYISNTGEICQNNPLIQSFVHWLIEKYGLFLPDAQGFKMMPSSDELKKRGVKYPEKGPPGSAIIDLYLTDCKVTEIGTLEISNGQGPIFEFTKNHNCTQFCKTSKLHNLRSFLKIKMNDGIDNQNIDLNTDSCTLKYIDTQILPLPDNRKYNNNNNNNNNNTRKNKNKNSLPSQRPPEYNIRNINTNTFKRFENSSRIMCRYYLRGCCTRVNCRFSHNF